MNTVKAKSSVISIRLLVAGILAFIGLYMLSRSDYLLFHSIVELLSVAVAFSVFVISWNARRFISNDYLLFIGIGFLFVSVLGTMHTLSYRGMGVFNNFEPTNLAAQFWIATRYLQSLILILAPIFVHRRLNTNAAFSVYGIATALIIFSVLVWQIFPTAYIVGSGLTAFKIVSEYAISAILLGAIFVLRRHHDDFAPDVVTYLTVAIAANIASEMAFTLYSDAYGFFNAIGHFLILVSTYFVYKAIIETGLSRPFDLMFHQLKQSEDRSRREADNLFLANSRLAAEAAEREKAQDAIKAAAEEWQATFDSITDIIMVLDPEHRIVRANRAFAKTFGMSVEAAIGKHCYEIVHDASRPPAFCPHVRTMNCDGEAKEEFLEPKLGVYIEAATLPIIDKDGECVGSVHIVKNIHERKLAEVEREKLHQQIDEQRSLLQNTLDQLPTGVVIRDSIGHLLRANTQVVQVFGQQPGLETTFDVNRSYHKNGRQYTPEEWPMSRTISSGESICNEEIDIVRNDGSRATVLASTSPIRNEKLEIIANVGVFRDITDRKEIEKEVESMARFPKENPNPVLRADNKCILVFANEASDYILSCWQIKIGEILPGYICQVIVKASSSGHDQIVDSVCGSRIFSMVFTPIKEFGYVNIYGRDITERKQAEEALNEFNATLEHRIEQRTLELKTAYADLSEQLKLRAQAEDSLRSLSTKLLSIQEDERRSIARELHDQTGQSLTVLKLMVGRADRMASEDMKPILKDTGNLIAEIIKQVRSLSLSLRPGILDDLGLVPAMEWLFKQLQSQADLQIHFEHNALSGQSPDTSTVLYRITQEALTNIMRHAGVKEAWVQLLSEDGRLRLKIEDHGRGFDTASSSMSTGLSAMRERAALLEGTCTIESSPGKGTTILIELPLDTAR